TQGAAARQRAREARVMNFLWPGNLLLVLVVPALIAAYVWAQRRRQKYALRYASLSLVREALGKGPGRKRHIPPALFLAALFFMALGTARPETVVVVPLQEGTGILALAADREGLRPDRHDRAALGRAKQSVPRAAAGHRGRREPRHPRLHRRRR